MPFMTGWILNLVSFGKKIWQIISYSLYQLEPVETLGLHMPMFIPVFVHFSRFRYGAFWR